MQRNIVTADESDDLASALRTMAQHGFRHLPVLSGNVLVGVLSQSDIMLQQTEGESRYDEQVGEAMSTPVDNIHPDVDVQEAAALMAVKRVGCLPVVEDRKLVGIVTTTDMLTAASHCRVDPRTAPVTDVGSAMFPRPGAVEPEDSLGTAITVMFQNGARHIAVIDAGMKVRGILSEGDVRRAIGNPLGCKAQDMAQRLRETRVEDVMTADPRRLRVEEPVERVVELLLERDLWALPVVDADDCFVGMVSYLDVVRRIGVQ